jgi:hypothetical protein
MRETGYSAPMSRQTFYRFHDGPLDGVEMPKRAPGRAPRFMLDDAGEVPPHLGERVTNPHPRRRRLRGAIARGVYVHSDVTYAAVGTVHHYRFTTRKEQTDD